MAKEKFDVKRILIISTIVAILVTAYNLIFTSAVSLGWDNVAFRFGVAIIDGFLGFWLISLIIPYTKKLFSWFNLASILLTATMTIAIYYFTGNVDTYSMWFAWVGRVIFIAIAILLYELYTQFRSK